MHVYEQITIDKKGSNLKENLPIYWKKYKGITIYIVERIKTYNRMQRFTEIAPFIELSI